MKKTDDGNTNSRDYDFLDNDSLSSVAQWLIKCRHGLAILGLGVLELVARGRGIIFVTIPR